MVKRSAKLRSVLARHQGRDLDKEIQKKLQREASKRKRARLEDIGAENANKETHDKDVDHEIHSLLNENKRANGSSQEDVAESPRSEDESDEEHSDLDTRYIDVSKLADSESDSSGDSSQDESPTNGIQPRPKTLQEQLASLVSSGKPDIEESLGRQETQEDDEELSQASSIPLSDIESGPHHETDADLIPHQRLTINNTAALTRSLNSFALSLNKLPFSEHQSLTTSEPVSIPDVNDDLNRELAFYKQALAAVNEGRELLKKEDIPLTRPADYFAEMVKSDEHMGRIKDKLMADAASKRAAQEARKQRDLRKFGKQVQQEKLKERAKSKKEMLEKVNVLKRKRQGAGLERDNEDDMFDVALEDAAETERKDRIDRKQKVAKADRRGSNGAPNAKRQKKDSKFGFGGKKRHAKSNDAQSSSDMSGFSVRKMKGKPIKQRPGKSRRAKTR